MRSDNTNLQNALEEMLISKAKNNNILIELHRGGASNCTYSNDSGSITTGQIGIQKANPQSPSERLIAYIDIIYAEEKVQEIKAEEFNSKEVLLKLFKYDFNKNKTESISQYALNENDALGVICDSILNHIKTLI